MSMRAMVVVGTTLVMAGSASAQSSLKDRVFQAILDAGGWSSMADDNGGRERISSETLSEVIAEFQAAKKRAEELTCGTSPQAASCPEAVASLKDATDALGELNLAISVAEWGIHWSGSFPADPDGHDWAGPPDIKEGKHLMSYAIGGIGLAHLDVGKAQDFLRETSRRLPEAEGDLRQFQRAFRYDPVRAKGGLCSERKDVVIMNDLNGAPFLHGAVKYGGTSYCRRFNPNKLLEAKDWQTFRNWARISLRDREMQRWVVEYWLSNVWRPTLARMGDKADITEAFVVSRIWNTSNGAAIRALENAAGHQDVKRRIRLELASYGHTRRHGLMQRMGVAFDHIAKEKVPGTR
ncbi:hypothetical protein [Rhizobium leguminosarum]|uniref:hypothetical protein n=1 Tax=Rhizobium leguminosarum TaxID=384 RepID=UPI003F9CDB15